MKPRKRYERLVRAICLVALGHVSQGVQALDVVEIAGIFYIEGLRVVYVILTCLTNGVCRETTVLLV